MQLRAWGPALTYPSVMAFVFFSGVLGIKRKASCAQDKPLLLRNIPSLPFDSLFGDKLLLHFPGWPVELVCVMHALVCESTHVCTYRSMCT